MENERNRAITEADQLTVEQMRKELEGWGLPCLMPDGEVREAWIYGRIWEIERDAMRSVYLRLFPGGIQ